VFVTRDVTDSTTARTVVGPQQCAALGLLSGRPKGARCAAWPSHAPRRDRGAARSSRAIRPNPCYVADRRHRPVELGLIGLRRLLNAAHCARTAWRGSNFSSLPAAKLNSGRMLRHILNSDHEQPAFQVHSRQEWRTSAPRRQRSPDSPAGLGRDQAPARRAEPPPP